MRVGIVGAGIAGLAYAWSAAERGHHVTVFERTALASGASIRNFGMVWPIGQPAGESHQIALKSRQRWLQATSAANIWANPCGSIHLAHRDDEWTVLQEFHALAAGLGVECSLLTREEVLTKTPAANPQGLLGGLWSPTEVAVNPPATIRRLPHWLSDAHNVKFQFHTVITSAETGRLQSADGQRHEFDHIIICCGADLVALFPELLQSSPLRLCKLQMLKTSVQPAGWRLGPHIASGLTLRHYHIFDVCPSLPALKQRIATETPELDQFGIHVMASQNDRGEVILGDSHEYGADIEPFDKQEIDELILRELRSIIQLPEWNIVERWHGIYAKHPTAPLFPVEPLPGVFVRTGVGGAGMTMSFGLAESDWEKWS